ncbi:polysaccharide export outer membrane protein [Plasticicumulans lactativorans]|uniref:Polysaccharide export outer membrane protein n=1 Tax=Plasticicumulans lactativorans TaxID=1133106 RepID=A0A4R2L5C2_9GAMM|nr:polysaccharide export protein [Plasticicumulans lactativorans]TCO80992.1 polysaccharide export outer membrane protein [Plasticicumulans lactativorans]
MIRITSTVAVAALMLNGCGFAPGMIMMNTDGESSVEVPVVENGVPVTAKAKITEINAQVVVEQVERQRLAYANAERPPREKYDRYRLGPRDILSITVWDHPELTIPAGEFRSAEAAGTLINEDGTIFYPYVGVLKAAGLTTDQLRDQISRKISTYIENPQIDVRVAAYRSKKIYVVGEVKEPGIQFINDIPMTVAEAINRAGGVTELADQRTITLSRNDKVYRIDLQGLYENGDLQQNVLLRDGDVLNAWDLSLNKIFVMGEVDKPQSLLMSKGRKTLAEAISDAGGISQSFGDPGQLYVIRSGSPKPEIFHLNARSPDSMLLADRFPLQPRDVVYVDTAGVTRWNRVISQILPTAQVLSESTVTHFPLFQGGTTNTFQHVVR